MSTRVLSQHGDSIAAIATAPGRGAVGIVRVSSPQGLAPLIRAVCGRELKPREATYLPFRDAAGVAIDQGLALHFPAPNSYTGEHVLELQAHGGAVVMQLLLARVIEAGEALGTRVRMAEPGEFTQAHGLRRLALDGVAISNSLCFSLDGRTLYYCDTLTQRLMCCDYDSASAYVGEPRLFAQKELAECWPDGSTIDAQGCLWNAEWGNAAVARYAPDGRLLGRHAVPAPCRRAPRPAAARPAGQAGWPCAAG